MLSVNGEIYITDFGNHRIQVFAIDQEGLKFVRLFDVKDPSTQKLCGPGDICVGPDGLLYVTCWNPHCLLVLTLSGDCVASLGGIRDRRHRQLGVAVDADGFV